tara:strand:- start:118 stop:495 length:378 start_codon:yes stop_codon:yes gene_type:complete
MMSFAIDKAFRNYFNFSGRSNRSEFWYFFLFILIGNFLTHLIDTYIIGYHPDEMGIVSGIFFLATAFPQLSLTFRRLHDTGKSGWWFLLSFTIIGLIPLLVWWCTTGDPKKNRYGNIPKVLSDFT